MSDAPRKTLERWATRPCSFWDGANRCGADNCQSCAARAALAAPDPLPAALDLLEAFDWYAMHAQAVVAALQQIAGKLDCETPCDMAPPVLCAGCGHMPAERWCAGCVARRALAALPTPPIGRTRSLLVAHGRGARWNVKDDEDRGASTEANSTGASQGAVPVNTQPATPAAPSGGNSSNPSGACGEPDCDVTCPDCKGTGRRAGRE